MLEIDGNPGGAVYLDAGHITFARSSWTPGLAARLTGSLPQGAGELTGLLDGGDRPARDLGAALIARGLLSAPQLREILSSALIDAVMALTVPLSDEASIAGIRFEPGKSHWSEAFCRIPVEKVRAAAIRSAERMTRYSLSDTVRLELIDLPRGRIVLRAGQWAVASRINGRLCARDLARRCGYSLSDTVQIVGELITAGVCGPAAPGQADPPVPPRRSRADQGTTGQPALPARRSAPGHRPASRDPGSPASRDPGSPASRDPGSTVPRQPGGAAARPAALPARAAAGPGRGAPVMPVRRPGAGAGGGTHRAPLAPATASPVSAESLRRVLEGLRRL